MGYTGNGTKCNDINECNTTSHMCHANATCANSVGSYNCTCKHGYSGNGTVCIGTCQCLYVIFHTKLQSANNNHLNYKHHTLTGNVTKTHVFQWELIYFESSIMLGIFIFIISILVMILSLMNIMGVWSRHNVQIISCW